MVGFYFNIKQSDHIKMKKKKSNTGKQNKRRI